MTKIYNTKLILLFVILILNNSLLLNAQTMADAMEAFENGQYDIASKSFEKLWKKDQSSNEINYMYGKSILLSNGERHLAIPPLETLIGNDINYKDATLLLAQAYTYNLSFEKARNMLDYFIKNNKSTNGEDEDEDDQIATSQTNAKILMSQIKTGELLVKSPLKVHFNNLGDNINTARSEFEAYIVPDGQTIYFTSDKKYDAELFELIKGGFYSNFTPDELNLWGKMTSLGQNVNTQENERIVGISHDGSKVLMAMSWLNKDADLFITSRVKKTFQELSELEKTINSEFDEPSGNFSKNEDTLYFASDRPGGFGGLDIYASVKLPNGTWGSPKNLGPEINSEYNETYPYISEDGSYLLFANDGPNSMGGFDIFKSLRIDDAWTKPINFGFPINDPYDNMTISFSKSKRYGYVSAIRPEGKGSRDVYQVIFDSIPPVNVLYTGTIKKGNEQSSEIVQSEISIKAIKLSDNSLFATSKYSKTGKYTFAFPPGEYKIQVNGAGFSTFEKNVRIPENEILIPMINYNILVN